jgi:hypothetical protein
MPQARLVVTRPDDSVGMLREALIHVDGSVAARLRPGRSATLDLAPGPHVVQAAMDWTTSAPLQVHAEPGETVHLEVSLPWSALWRSFTSPRTAMSLERRGAGSERSSWTS